MSVSCRRASSRCRIPACSRSGYSVTAGEVVAFIEHFAALVARSGPDRRGRARGSGARRGVQGLGAAEGGELGCRAVVIASGACNQPSVPQFTDAVPASVEQLTPFDYRAPAKLPDGGVLVVGDVGDRRAAGRRAAAVGPAGDPVGGGAHAVAAHVPRPRCAVVEWTRRACAISGTTSEGVRPGPTAALAQLRSLARPNAGR